MMLKSFENLRIASLSSKFTSSKIRYIFHNYRYCFYEFKLNLIVCLQIFTVILLLWSLGVIIYKNFF